jgi:hypothetical protein
VPRGRSSSWLTLKFPLEKNVRNKLFYFWAPAFSILCLWNSLFSVKKMFFCEFSQDHLSKTVQFKFYKVNRMVLFQWLGNKLMTSSVRSNLLNFSYNFLLQTHSNKYG